MSLVVLSTVAACGLLLLWLVQSIALKLVGEPLALPLRFEAHNPIVKWTSRVMIHTTWFIILIGTPFALGISPLKWLRQEFPLPPPWYSIAIVFSVMLLSIFIANALWIALGWVRLEKKHDGATLRGKLIRRFIGPWPLATLEEAVFRGVVLEQMLQTLPQTNTFTAIAILLSAAVFSSIHFVKRPRADRPIWQPAYGLFIIGCLLGLAYVISGRSLWVPIALHAAAVLGIEVMRLFVVYKGPPWLLGYPEFPQSGLIGSLVVVAIAIVIVVAI